MELKDTVELMFSEDWKDRLRAEYWQTKCRYGKVRKITVKIAAATLQAGTDMEPSELAAFLAQAKAMRKYLEALEIRAEINRITL